MGDVDCGLIDRAANVVDRHTRSCVQGYLLVST